MSNSWWEKIRPRLLCACCGGLLLRRYRTPDCRPGDPCSTWMCHSCHRLWKLFYHGVDLGRMMRQEGKPILTFTVWPHFPRPLRDYREDK